MTTKNGRHPSTSLQPGVVVWRKSSYSGGSEGQCVQIGNPTGTAHTDTLGVRDSKDPSGPVLLFPMESFADFILGIKAGEFDI